MARHGEVRSGIISLDAAGYGSVRLGRERFVTVWLALDRRSLVRRGSVWHGELGLGVTR